MSRVSRLAPSQNCKPAIKSAECDNMPHYPNNYPPMAGANPAYAAAYQQQQQQQQQAALRYYQQQQQRTSSSAPAGVYVGGAAVIQGSSSNTQTSNYSSRSATAASANTASTVTARVSAPPPPPGKYVNETLKILGGLSEESAVSSKSNSTKKRRSECIEDLERLVPPLFSQSAVHSSLSDKNNEVDSTEKTNDATTTEAAGGSHRLNE
eukprot:scaffold2177_cov136-Skeletonema_menzelii.AAC.15